MAITLDLSNWYTYFPNSEAVSYFSRTAESPVNFAAAVAVGNAVREVEDRKESGPGGALLARRTTAFHVGQAQLGATVPKKGDQLVDSLGVTYVVQDGLDYERSLTRMWRLPVQQAV